MAEPRKIYGRDHYDRQARLNDFRPIRLGNRPLDEEISFVLFDKFDDRHKHIPSVISSESELPHGALVVSVDMGDLPAAEVAAYKEQGVTPIPERAHAIYLTGRERQLEGIEKAMRRKLDKRSHGDDEITPQSVSEGVGVAWDKDTEAHLHVPGLNHPESPVEGLRRVATATSLYKLVERLSVDGPSGSAQPGNPALGDKNSLLSSYTAKDLALEIKSQVNMRTSRAEAGLFQRMQWPKDDNLIDSHIGRLRESDARITADAAAQEARRPRSLGDRVGEPGTRVTPTACHDGGI